ncbi:sphingosine kinase [Nannochloropsis oceanica]
MTATTSFIDYRTQKLVRLVMDGIEPYIDIEGSVRTLLRDVVGSSVIETLDQTQGCKLLVFAYPRRTDRNCLCGNKRLSLERQAQHLRLTAPASSVAKHWDALIKKWCRGGHQGGEEDTQLQRRRRRLLVLVNPKSGKQQAHSIYTAVVAPMLAQADIEHEMVVTMRMQHAKDMIYALDVEAWDGVVAIGGDGLLSDVINGLFSRDPENQRALLELPVAIVNGADVDLESEVIRWAGALRMDLFSLYAIFRSRTYRARLSFWSCEEGESSFADAIHLPPLHTPLPMKNEWISIEDDFLTILISHVSHIAEAVHSAPGKKMGDGTFQLMVLRRQSSLSRMRLISLFMALEHGDHVPLKEVEIYHARAYRLEPLTDQGRYSLDGETIPFGHVQGKILPLALQVLCDS